MGSRLRKFKSDTLKMTGFKLITHVTHGVDSVVMSGFVKPTMKPTIISNKSYLLPPVRSTFDVFEGGGNSSDYDFRLAWFSQEGFSTTVGDAWSPLKWLRK